jgi:hypothetical protein
LRSGRGLAVAVNRDGMLGLVIRCCFLRTPLLKYGVRLNGRLWVVGK